MGKEKQLQDWVAEARKRLWDAEYIRKNDQRREGESDEHWQHRKARNKARVERREEVVKTLKKRLDALRQHKEEIKHQEADTSGDWKNLTGFATWEGKTVPAWMVYWLNKSREAGWTGTVVSGVRTPEYSEQLCYNMCNAPTCPGKCAGRTSNHNMQENQGYPFGAVDVSDYDRFESIQWQINSPLKNDLPIDPVHFSVSGH